MVTELVMTGIMAMMEMTKIADSPIAPMLETRLNTATTVPGVHDNPFPLRNPTAKAIARMPSTNTTAPSMNRIVAGGSRVWLYGVMRRSPTATPPMMDNMLIRW